MRSRIVSIIRKEVLHILRDAKSLFIIFMMPIIMVVLYGYAITFDIKEIKLGVVDYDQSAASRELVQKFTNAGYFKLTARARNKQDVEELIRQRKIIAALVIPADYQRSLGSRLLTKVQLLIDGSNANTATIVSNYAGFIIRKYSTELNQHIINPTFAVEARIWYNPDMKSAHFVVPGLVAVLMMMICAILTSITIAREKETGTMEQILVSPIRPFEIIVGKVTPYILLSFLVSVIILVSAQIIFNVPFRGSVFVLAFFTMIYIYASLSLGIFVSSRATSQQAALMGALLGTLLPSILLSGFVFPISSMPWVLRAIAQIVPAKHFLIIIRGVILKGIGAEYFWKEGLVLFIFGTLVLAISIKKFSIRLEE